MNRASLPIEGILLAGGQSRRMGEPKTALPWHGVPLLTHMVRVIQPMVKDLWIVGYDGELDLLGITGVRAVHEAKKVGPLGGLFLGLQAVTTEKALVAPCDLPFLSPATIRFLYDHSREADIVVPRTPDGLHPLLGIYSRACLEPLREALAQGYRRPVSIFPAVRVVYLDHGPGERPWGKTLFNLNSPADLTEARNAEREPPPRQPG